MESSAHTQQLHKNKAELEAWIENQICWEQTGSKESCAPAGELGYSQEGWTWTRCVQEPQVSVLYIPGSCPDQGQMLCRKIELYVLFCPHWGHFSQGSAVFQLGMPHSRLPVDRHCTSLTSSVCHGFQQQELLLLMLRV